MSKYKLITLDRMLLKVPKKKKKSQCHQHKDLNLLRECDLE